MFLKPKPGPGPRSYHTDLLSGLLYLGRNLVSIRAMFCEEIWNIVFQKVGQKSTPFFIDYGPGPRSTILIFFQAFYILARIFVSIWAMFCEETRDSVFQKVGYKSTSFFLKPARTLEEYCNIYLFIFILYLNTKYGKETLQKIK